MGKYSNLHRLFQEGLLTQQQYNEEMRRAEKQYDDLKYDSIEVDYDYDTDND